MVKPAEEMVALFFAMEKIPAHKQDDAMAVAQKESYMKSGELLGDERRAYLELTEQIRGARIWLRMSKCL